MYHHIYAFNIYIYITRYNQFADSAFSDLYILRSTWQLKIWQYLLLEKLKVLVSHYIVGSKQKVTMSKNGQIELSPPMSSVSDLVCLQEMTKCHTCYKLCSKMLSPKIYFHQRYVFLQEMFKSVLAILAHLECNTKLDNLHYLNLINPSNVFQKE